jgi:thiol peroxidase
MGLEEEEFAERKNIVTIKGNPLTLIGRDIKVGDRAPQFVLPDKNLKQIALKDYAGKVKIISVTPSLDTAVCDMQARKFNDEAVSRESTRLSWYPITGMPLSALPTAF